MRNQVFSFLDDIIVVIHGPRPPSDEEAHEYLTAFKSRDISRLRCLIFTEGGAPTAAQRKRLNELLGGRAFPTAVVTNLPLVRGVVTALSWFNPKIRAFTPEAAEEAFRYLGIPSVRYPGIHAEVKKLKALLKQAPDSSFTQS